MQRVSRRSRLNPGRLAPAVFVLALAASTVRADDAMQWLARASQAARQLNYVGTII
jgi:negative regulator of sigma E activity